MDKAFACAPCGNQSCLRGEFDRMPPACPTLSHPAIARDAQPYAGEGLHAEMVNADATPFDPEGRPRTRVEELIAFAKARGFKNIGVAFCVSLTRESQLLGRLLRKEGIETSLVCCRVGAIDYEDVGLVKAHPDRFAATCNPVAQARLLNAKEVELVVQVGLCIGHDLILQRECLAPVTTLVVKDRVFDHQPVRALRQTIKAEAEPEHAFRVTAQRYKES